LHFGQVLHLLHLLGHGRMHGPSRAAELAEEFVDAGYPLRNAGALCARLCREIHPVPAPVGVKQVCGLLWSTPLMADLLLRWKTRASGTVEVPPIGPNAFEIKVLRELGELGREEWAHWLRHGCAPPG